jgi:hypothetical protein
MYDNRTDNAGLTDDEFACLLFRSCGVPLAQIRYNLGIIHTLECGFCQGEKKVAS